jgi:hypothetical protein
MIYAPRDRQYIATQEYNDDIELKLDYNPKTRNIKGYKSDKVLER